jgi:hypothetical protein
MRRLTHTLSRTEISRLLEVSPALLDALVDSGRVLCRMQSGEARIPLDQLEDFFRDMLVRLYEIEAKRNVESEEAHAPTLEKPFTPPVPVPVQTNLPPRVSEMQTDVPTPAQRMETERDVPTTTGVSDESEGPDQRFASRFVPLRQIDGFLNDMKFTIVQISSTGMRIRHREPLVPGVEAKLSFALIKPARSFVMRVRVVWTSLARSGDEHFSISGLRVIEHGERLARAVEILNASHELQPERRAKPRRADDVVALDGISDDDIAKITAAVQKFAEDPLEASRWYSRARFSLSDENVRRVAPARARDREEVLGVWEYLDRQVDLTKVAGVMAWMRHAN